MPNLLDIRRRIRTVKNTQQITQAMKMVSAAKLRRAQEQALAARPYARQIHELMTAAAGWADPDSLADAKVYGAAVSDLIVEVGATADGSGTASGAAQPRFGASGVPEPARAQAGGEAGRPRQSIVRRLVVAVTSDKGLAGAFNGNVIKAVLALAEENPDVELRLELVGRKGRDFFRRHHYQTGGDYSGVFGRTVDFEAARRLARTLIERFAAGEADEVLLAGNVFKSVIQQRVVVRRLLPLELPASGAREAAPPPLFDTPPARLLAALLPRYLEAQIAGALLESFAAEHAARMNAMASATDNAGDLIESLTLNMNRVRQAAITKEIIEVVSGAAALE